MDGFGNLLNLSLNKSNDIDVFLTGDDYLEKAANIINKLMIYGICNFPRIHYTESSISFNLNMNVKIQIIKRAYSNVEEILGGFDLNASKVALLLNKKDNWKFVSTQSYIDAVQYGINVVVPCWQSQTFNSRLNKYIKKGYDIYLPGNIIKRFNIADNKDTNAFANLTELVTYVGNPHKWNMKDLSDYEADTLNYLAKIKGIVSNLIGIDKRVIPILKGEMEPNINDLIYMINCKIKVLYRESMKSKDRFTFYAFIRNILPLFWRTTDPSTQLTGSFNPTTSNYLSGEKSEVVRIITKNSCDKILYHKLLNLGTKPGNFRL